MALKIKVVICNDDEQLSMLFHGPWGGGGGLVRVRVDRPHCFSLYNKTVLPRIIFMGKVYAEMGGHDHGTLRKKGCIVHQ